MGLILKKDEEEHEEIEGIEIIERSDVPDDLPENDVELESGPSAEDIAREGRSQREEDGKKPDEGPRRPRRAALLVAVAVIAVVVAAVLGYFVGSGGFAPQTVSSGTVTEDELDLPLASYTYNGVEHTISAREAIEGQYSLDAAQNDDGTYTVPSAEIILTDVRNKILVADAEARGIEVSDDDMASYAEETLGISDFGELADQYQISEDQAREIVYQNAVISKLYEQIVPESTVEMPEQPTAPADGDENASSADYATYIIGLLGDEWDSASGTWARTDGDMYAAIGGENFDGQTATYAQATAAFYVAYQDYYEAANSGQQAWTSYANGLYAACDLKLFGIFQ